MRGEEKTKSSATRNACKLCSPLGGCIVFRGVKGAVPFLHGSQGCATYIRRYIISHFREPMDIASSSFSEESAIYGGRQNLYQGLKNVTSQYQPQLIGIATTCLSETIGDDLPLFIRQYKEGTFRGRLPLLVNASTPSYRGSHMEGFHQTVKALVGGLAKKGSRQQRVNVFPGFVSCADIRYLKEIFADFSLPHILLPDYSETLDAPLWNEYKRIPEGGTEIKDIMRMGAASASLEFGRTQAKADTAGKILLNLSGVPLHNLGLPIGINETDMFFSVLEQLSASPTPEKHKMERGRLIDAYVDGHKYVFGKRAIVYGEEDLVVGIASFLSEIGIIPVLCASGGKSGWFKESIAAVTKETKSEITVLEGADFVTIAEAAERVSPDFLIGNSKGYFLSRKLGIPLVRVGFPIHDRIGGQRVLHLGYRGGQELFDRIVNAVMERQQDSSDWGYSYV